MIPAAFGAEFGICTPADPPDEAHEQLCTAVLADYGYTLVSDTLCLVLGAQSGNAVCYWTLHRCAYAGAA
jgi:hypothetical protein